MKTILQRVLALASLLLATPVHAALVPRTTCLTNCAADIASMCTVTKHGKPHIKPPCKHRIIRQCRHGRITCTTTTTMTTTTTSGGKTLTLTVPPTGSDLDNGWTGTSHNFPIINGSSIQYTLTCPNNGPDCTGSGVTGAGTANGTTFGAPLPLLAANVPVCVVNRFKTSTLTGTFNTQTGAAGVSAPNMVPLNSDVYLRTTFSEVCPKCVIAGGGGDLGSTGTCSSTSKSPGTKCTVNGKVTVAGKGLYLLSTDCPPLGDSAPTTLDIELPLTTGQAPPLVGPMPCPDSAGPQTSDDSCSGPCNARCTGAACASTDAAGNCIDAKGGISQLCCANNTTIPCFPTSTASKAAGLGSIIRTGSPVKPGDAVGGVFAGTFCIARTDSSLINITTGLPGPGALLLPSVAVLK